MDIFNFSKFHDAIKIKRFQDSYYEDIAKFLRDLTQFDILGEIKETNIFFYPRYLWQKEKQPDIFFITQTKIVECKSDTEDNISITTRSTKDIELVKITKYNFEHSEIELCLYFTNGDSITFKSTDANDSWKHEFFERISQIHKLFLYEV